MENFFERLKDILYDSVDYIIMLAIVIGVISLIGWRLDILFAKDNLDNEHEGNIKVETPKEPTEVPKVDKSQKDGESDKDSSEDKDKDDNGLKEDSDDSQEKEPDEQTTIVTIYIPEGSLPSKIGSILESNGLVKDKNDFVLKAQELNLDRKLRSGKYEIKKDASIEEIVKKIARQN